MFSFASKLEDLNGTTMASSGASLFSDMIADNA